MFAIAVAATATAVILGREKFIDREAHFAEQIAGIVGCRAAALLTRHAVVVNRHQHLHIADELDDGKDTDGDIDDLAVGLVTEVAAVLIADTLRNASASATAVAVAAVTGLAHACGENDGFCNLNAAAREIAGGHFLRIAAVSTIFAVEYFHTSLAAVQDDLFLEHTDTADGVAGHITSSVDIQLDFKEKGQIAGIIASIERQCFHVDVCCDDLSFSGAYGNGMIDDHLIPLCKVYAQVFQTILVRAGIVDSAGINANRLFTAVFMYELVVRPSKSSCS